MNIKTGNKYPNARPERREAQERAGKEEKPAKDESKDKQSDGEQK